MSVKWPVPIEDLEELRKLLSAVLNYHEASDIANATKNLAPETRFSPLTAEVAIQLDTIRTHLKDWKFAEYEEEEEVAIEVDVPEGEEDSEQLRLFFEDGSPT